MAQPTYSTQVFHGERGSSLEVLRDGKPFTWGPGFRVTRLTMSRNEAKALLEFEQVIRTFDASEGREPPVAKKHLAQVDIHLWAIEKQTSFKVDETMVQQPWLVLSYIKKSGVAHAQLGFGLDKTRGILEVWSDLLKFAG